jgi:succinyl-CoA synthetase beta subunit
MGTDAAEAAREILEGAAAQGHHTLSEHDAKRLLAGYGVPITREVIVACREEVVPAAAQIGYPLVMKACSAAIAHKTEQGLVRLDLRSDAEALHAFDEISAAMAGLPGAVLVQEMVRGDRELAIGLVRDDDFGPCVMFGLGGIFTEILEDAVFRRAPLEEADALALMEEIRGCRILDAVRGLPAADRGALAGILIRIGRLGLDHDGIQEIDLNPVILAGSRPVVVDALIVLR